MGNKSEHVYPSIGPPLSSELKPYSPTHHLEQSLDVVEKLHLNLAHGQYASLCTPRLHGSLQQLSHLSINLLLSL